MQHHRTIQLLLCLLLSVALTSSAHAQINIRQVNAQSFEPSTDPRGILTTDSAATQGHFKWHLGVYFSYVNDPLRAGFDGETLYRYVHDQVMMDLVFSLGIWRYFELGLALPVALYQSSEGDPAQVGGNVPGLKSTAVGDIRVVPKVRFWRNRSHGFGLALIPQLTIPTMSEANLSDGRVSFEPKVVLDYRFSQGTLLTLNLGYRLRKEVQVGNLRVDDELFYGIGVEVPVYKRRLAILGELYGAVGFRDADADNDRGIDSEEAPLEALLGVRYRFDVGLILTGGAGVGLTDGYGSPDFRLFLGVAYASTVKSVAKPGDRDGDGIKDQKDRCPDEPEDQDGFQDQDGCPDSDNDKDGVCDDNPTIQKNLDRFKGRCTGRDIAPLEPEDRDGFEDSDGKPDPDNDNDGVCDDNPTIQKNLDRYSKRCTGQDIAPLDPEDRDGFEDGDGKPEPDNDKDGVCDNNPTIQKNLDRYRKVCRGADRCPGEPEDTDGFEDHDGCPDPDNDRDGFCDSNKAIQKNLNKYRSTCSGLDKCPNKKEIINGVKDKDGCPDKGRSKVIITRKKIVILDKVYFRTNRARIMRKSYSLLRQVATTMKSYPWILKVRIEGHTDARGRAPRNLRLSTRRAQAVRRFLIKRGVAPSRLMAKGYGESAPIKAGCGKLRRRRDRKTCWGLNRRVAFTIAKVDRSAPADTTVKSR